jgi:hypothetical protein
MVHFIRKLKSIHPDLVISQPTYGYPQVIIHPSGSGDISAYRISAGNNPSIRILSYLNPHMDNWISTCNNLSIQI